MILIFCNKSAECIELDTYFCLVIETTFLILFFSLTLRISCKHSCALTYLHLSAEWWVIFKKKNSSIGLGFRTTVIPELNPDSDFRLFLKGLMSALGLSVLTQGTFCSTTKKNILEINRLSNDQSCDLNPSFFSQT